MIEIFKWEKKWRIKIVNETLELKDKKDLEETLKKIIQIKEDKEPYKK